MPEILNPAPPSNTQVDATTKRQFEPTTASSRRSGRVRNPVDCFTFDKSHGYFSVISYVKKLVGCLLMSQVTCPAFDANYLAALALDPEFIVLDRWDMVPPTYLTTNPFMFKSKSKSDPDTPSIKEALN